MYKILFASSEIHPLIKTGGLGDVSGSLPTALKNLGQDMRLIMPAYRAAVARAGALTPVANLSLSGADHPVTLLEGRLPGTDVPLYLVDSPAHFDRPGGPYDDPDGHGWPDNAARFALLARATVALGLDQAGLAWRPDIVHCNDWQTALAPALLAREPQRPGLVFTVHNLAYQGVFSWDTFQSLHLPAELWSADALEFYGQVSFIKGGLIYADYLNTVSPTYAQEIRTPEFGCGLDGLLNHRAERLVGILNGADYHLWDPRRDPFIAKKYTPRTLTLKANNKAALQQHFNLAEDPEVPLLGFIGRLVEQKGVDLLFDVLDELLTQPLQLAVLGSGAPHLEQTLLDYARRYPQRVGVHVGYHEQLAHHIEAGADLFVMPSRFEPCGLNQLYSLRYGTVPVVRRTGGLADSVVDATPHTLKDKTATGFLFDAATPTALRDALQRALALYQQPRKWRPLMKRGMEQDFSWEHSAGQYLALYERAHRCVRALRPALSIAPHT